MSYVEHCPKHGQYHADYICGDCHEELKAQVTQLQSALGVAREAALEEAALQVEHLPSVGFFAAKRIRALKGPQKENEK